MYHLKILPTKKNIARPLVPFSLDVQRTRYYIGVYIALEAVTLPKIMDENEKDFHVSLCQLTHCQIKMWIT